MKLVVRYSLETSFELEIMAITRELFVERSVRRGMLSLKSKVRLAVRMVLCAGLLVATITYGFHAAASARFSGNTPPRATCAADGGVGDHCDAHATSRRRLGSHVALLPNCTDEFFCPGRYWEKNVDGETKNVVHAALDGRMVRDFGNGTSASDTHKYDYKCITDAVDCLCCDDGMEGNECRTRVIVSVPSTVTLKGTTLKAVEAELEKNATLVTKYTREDNTVHYGLEIRPLADVTSPASAGLAFYEVLIVIPQDTKGRSIVPASADFVKYQRALVDAKAQVRAAAVKGGGTAAVKVHDNVTVASMLLESAHQQGVSNTPGRSICHPCCYTKNTRKPSAGSTHQPGFDGDYESCLNSHDSWKDNGAIMNSKFDAANPVSPYNLNAKCSTMAGYPPMAVDAFNNGGLIIYIIGMM